jgi:hypothetical protein
LNRRLDHRPIVSAASNKSATAIRKIGIDPTSGLLGAMLTQIRRLRGTSIQVRPAWRQKKAGSLPVKRTARRVGSSDTKRADGEDNCGGTPNADQTDRDEDGDGDVCDGDVRPYRVSVSTGTPDDAVVYERDTTPHRLSVGLDRPNFSGQPITVDLKG